MRKRSNRKPVQATPPMIVVRRPLSLDIEVGEYMAIHAFTRGAANIGHLKMFYDMRNMLDIANTKRPGHPTLGQVIEEQLDPVLQSIKDRLTRTGKLGVTASELKMLRKLVEFNKEFWNRQPITLFHQVYDEMRAFYKERETQIES